MNWPPKAVVVSLGAPEGNVNSFEDGLPWKENEKSHSAQRQGTRQTAPNSQIGHYDPRPRATEPRRFADRTTRLTVAEGREGSESVPGHRAQNCPKCPKDRGKGESMTSSGGGIHDEIRLTGLKIIKWEKAQIRYGRLATPDHPIGSVSTWYHNLRVAAGTRVPMCFDIPDGR